MSEPLEALILERLEHLTYLVEQQGKAIDALLAQADNLATGFTILQQRITRVEGLSVPPPSMPTPPAPPLPGSRPSSSKR